MVRLSGGGARVSKNYATTSCRVLSSPSGRADRVRWPRHWSRHAGTTRRIIATATATVTATATAAVTVTATVTASRQGARYAPGRPTRAEGESRMAPGSPKSDPDRWWHGGVFYQIYPRSYADSDGDGVGDLPGIVSKLDHLAGLGISGVWLSPVTCSPNRDWGYDVSDYRDIDPDYGTLDDLDALVRAAGERGIRILMDLVPNHTSDRASLVRRRTERPGLGAPRLLRVGRPQARREPAQQLDEHLRRPGLAARRGERSVLPAQLRGGPTGPQLVERGRAARVRRDRALLVGPRRGRLPDRRVQHDDQGQGAARQPARERGRPAGPAVHGCAGRLQHRPPRGPRHPAPLARHRGHLRARAAPHRRDQRRAADDADAVLRGRARRAARRLQLRLHQRAVRGRRPAERRRGHRGAAPRGRVAHLDGLEPRRVAAGHPLGGRRRRPR